MKRLNQFILLITFFYTNATLGAVVHHIQYDQLVGATGIEIDNALYSVQFIDGSCIQLFNNCDETTDFFFSDIATAHRANLALLEQVLLDLPSGLFDNRPDLTNGCYSDILCSIITPVGSAEPQLETFSSVFLTNKIDPLIDIHTGSGTTLRATDFGLRNLNADTFTYALWDRQTDSGVSVPVPASLFLFCSVIFSALVLKKRSAQSFSV
ncbi:MAG: hypothetical protein ACPG3T_00400 [Pseudomonadales bacterium]